MRRTAHVIVLVLMAALAAGAAAAAPLDAQKLAAVQKAANDFAALAKDSHTDGKPPRQSDPAVAALLDAIFDTSALQSPEPLPFDQLGMLNQWTVAILKAGAVYMLAGSGTADLAKAAGDASLVEHIERNTAEYAPEMGRYLDAQIRIMDAMIRSVVAHIASDPQALENPNVRGGLAKIRAGTKQNSAGGGHDAAQRRAQRRLAPRAPPRACRLCTHRGQVPAAGGRPRGARGSPRRCPGDARSRGRARPQGRGRCLSAGLRAPTPPSPSPAARISGPCPSRSWAAARRPRASAP